MFIMSYSWNSLHRNIFFISNISKFLGTTGGFNINTILFIFIFDNNFTILNFTILNFIILILTNLILTILNIILFNLLIIIIVLLLIVMIAIALFVTTTKLDDTSMWRPIKRILVFLSNSFLSLDLWRS